MEERAARVWTDGQLPQAGAGTFADMATVTSRGGDLEARLESVPSESVVAARILPGNGQRMRESA